MTINNNDFDIINDDIIRDLNDCFPIVDGILLSEDNKTCIIQTNFLDDYNDLVEIYIQTIGDVIYLSDDGMLNNHFMTKMDRDIDLSDIANIIGRFPVTQELLATYTYKEDKRTISNKELICNSSIDRLCLDLLYFCQVLSSVCVLIRHL